MPNFGSCKKNSHSVSLQCQSVTYLSICQIVIGILGSYLPQCLPSHFPLSAWFYFLSTASASCLKFESSYCPHLTSLYVSFCFFLSPSLPSFPSVLFSLLSVGAQTEMKKVVGDNATLPCHHQFPSSNSLDIEWLLQKPNSKQKVVRYDSFDFLFYSHLSTISVSVLLSHNIWLW